MRSLSEPTSRCLKILVRAPQRSHWWHLLGSCLRHHRLCVQPRHSCHLLGSCRPGIQPRRRRRGCSSRFPTVLCHIVLLCHAIETSESFVGHYHARKSRIYGVGDDRGKGETNGGRKLKRTGIYNASRIDCPISMVQQKIWSYCRDGAGLFSS